MGLSDFGNRNMQKGNDLVQIFAELNRSQFNLIVHGGASIEIPYGVEMHNKNGSRGFHFVCQDEETAKILQNGLDNSSISWQKE